MKAKQDETQLEQEQKSPDPLARLKELLSEGLEAAIGARITIEAFFDKEEREPCNNDNYCRLVDWMKKAKKEVEDGSH